MTKRPTFIEAVFACIILASIVAPVPTQAQYAHSVSTNSSVGYNPSTTTYKIYIDSYPYAPVLTLWDPRGGPDTRISCKTWAEVIAAVTYFYRYIASQPYNPPAPMMLGPIMLPIPW
jgi:hypothetical protein